MAMKKLGCQLAVLLAILLFGVKIAVDSWKMHFANRDALAEDEVKARAEERRENEAKASTLQQLLASLAGRQDGSPIERASCEVFKSGRALSKRYGGQYDLIGMMVLANESDSGTMITNKETARLFNQKLTPVLFVYVLQDKTNPVALLVSVSQSNGKSIEEISIEGSAVRARTRIGGEGIYWDKEISSRFVVPDKTYEARLLAQTREAAVIEVAVPYVGIRKSAGHFANEGSTMHASFVLHSSRR